MVKTFFSMVDDVLLLLSTLSSFMTKDHVRIADRLRPSSEQVSAQKGSKRLEMLLSAVLRYTKAKTILVCNLTGYVEELALAVT